MGEAIREVERGRGSKARWFGLGAVAVAAALAFGGAASRVAAITIPWGTMSSGVGVHYNNNGGGENPANVAYFRAQATKDPHNVVDQNLGVVGTSVSGAPFAFDNTLDIGGLTLKTLFGDVGQYAIDLVVVAPTSDNSVPIPQLIGFTRVDGLGTVHFPPIVASTVSWAINDYRGLGSPGSYISVGDLNGDMTINASDLVVQTGTGPTNVDTVVNSLLKGVGLSLATSNVMQSGPVFTATFSGELVSDGNVYPSTAGYAPLVVQSLGLTGRFFFSGSLSYDSTGDTGTDLIDFYAGTAGTIMVTAEAFPSTALTVSSARLRYANGGNSNGKAKIKALIDDNQTQTLATDLVAGSVSVDILDNGQFNANLPLTGCQLRAHGRLRCLSADRKTRARFFPTKQGPFIYNVFLTTKGLSPAVTGNAQPAGPVVVRINQTSFSRVDLISQCNAPSGKKFISCLEP